jgi:hypothetical protein
MKFNSAAEIDAYINCIEKKFLDVKEDSPILQRHGWAIEDINPYNKDYIDLFLVASSSRYPKVYYKFLGYSNVCSSSGEKSSVYRFHFSCVSYSYTELNVLLCYYNVTGVWKNGNPIFHYFDYFDVPMDESFQRVFYLKNAN